MRAMSTVRAPIDAVVVALVAGDDRTARAHLWTWGWRLRADRLASGPIWMLEMVHHLQPMPPRVDDEGSQALWAALQDLAPSLTHPRLVFGRWAFWELAAREFWATDDFDAIERRLSGVVGSYDPVVYLVWGRYQARQGKRVTGGKYLLLSGCAEAEDQPIIDVFIRSCQRMQPQQVWTLLPKAFRSRGVRMACAERVLTDLQAIPGPPWLTRRPTPKYWWEKET